MRRARLLVNKRDEFSKRTKLDAFVRSGGQCEYRGEFGWRCEVRFTSSNPAQYDHIIAASNGGRHDLNNCQCLCRAHHREKTGKLDIPRAAKTERLRQKHVAGIR